jgi:hypothetical protein
MNAITQFSLDPVQVGQIFAASGLFPDMVSEAQCATKLIVGQGMGLSPYDSMTGLHVIKGKVTLAANLMAAAIKRSGKYDYRAKTDENACVITFYDVSGIEPSPIGTTTFTMDDARRADLGGVNWKKYPKAMLFARCISAGYREHCPDSIGGGGPVYVESHGETELGVTVTEHNASMAALPPASPLPSTAPQAAPAASADPTPVSPPAAKAAPKRAVAPSESRVKVIDQGGEVSTTDKHRSYEEFVRGQGGEILKITPAYIDEGKKKSGDPMWTVKDSDGNRYRVWDEAVKDTIEANKGTEITVTVGAKNSRFLREITNVDGVFESTPEPELVTATDSGVTEDDIPF